MGTINPENLVVGQEVVVCSSMYGSPISYQFGYVIKKITPTGQMTVAHKKNGDKMRFDNRGWEYGTGSVWNRAWLDVDVDGARKAQAERKIVDAAADFLNEITKMDRLKPGSHRETAMDRIKLIQIKLDSAKKILEENK
jgi:hypothetical protein